MFILGLHKCLSKCPLPGEWINTLHTIVVKMVEYNCLLQHAWEPKHNASEESKSQKDTQSSPNKVQMYKNK